MSDFFSKEENKFFKDYFKKGYSVFNVKNLDSLKYIKKGTLLKFYRYEDILSWKYFISQKLKK